MDFPHGHRLRPSRRLVRRLALLLLLPAALVVAGCQADLRVDVTVADDGSGVVQAAVELDAEAAAALRDLEEDANGIPLEDLAASGWQTEPPTETSTGGVEIRASKPFGDPPQLTEILEELGGENGIFKNFVLSRQQSFGQLAYSLTGQLDVSGGFNVFADPQLEQVLVAETQSLQSLAEIYGAQEQDINIRLSVTMPGQLQEDASNGAPTEGELSVTSSWRRTLLDNEIPVALATTERSMAAQVLRGASVVAGVLAAIVVLARFLRYLGSRRRQRSRPVVQGPVDAKGRAVAKVDPANESHQDLNLGGGPPQQRPGTFRVVALDGMGVLYQEGDDINRLLIPFARGRGSTVPDDLIRSRAREMSLGRMTTASFWPSIGVFGDANYLDNEYLALHQLTPGVVKYMRRLRSHGIRAACITNDAAEWANKLRINHSLDTLVDLWVVSGSVGVRKPEVPLFEVLRRVTGEPPHLILVIDDNLDTLDAARAFGFGTAWFNPGGTQEQARGHELMRNFDTGDTPDPAEAATGVPGEAFGN